MEMSNLCDNVNCDLEPIKTAAKTCNDNGVAWPTFPGKAKLPIRVGFAIVGGVIIDDVKFPNDERFSEIKKIQRKVIITQAKIVCKQLIVEGFVKKNIMYTTPITPGTNQCCPVVRNELRDIELTVPFCFTTSLHALPLSNLKVKQENESLFLENTMGDNVCDIGIMGEADCAKVNYQYTPLNKPPFAELEGSTICELAINRHGCRDGLYDVFTEKFVLKMTFAIYEYRHCFVHCPPFGNSAAIAEGLDNTPNEVIEEEISEGLSRLTKES